MDFTFYMPVRVLSGPGCVRAGGELLRGLGRRCLVMTGGRGAKESGVQTLTIKITASRTEPTLRLLEVYQ